MDISKLFAVIGCFLLIVCLTLSITTLVVLRNAIAENGEMQENAAGLINRLSGSISQFDQAVSASQNEIGDDDADLPTNATPSLIYLREYNGKIAVYTVDGRMLDCLDVSVSLLPKKDREALASGIAVDSLEALLELIEDYTS